MREDEFIGEKRRENRFEFPQECRVHRFMLHFFVTYFQHRRVFDIFICIFFDSQDWVSNVEAISFFFFFSKNINTEWFFAFYIYIFSTPEIGSQIYKQYVFFIEKNINTEWFLPFMFTSFFDPQDRVSNEEAISFFFFLLSKKRIFRRSARSRDQIKFRKPKLFRDSSFQCLEVMHENRPHLHPIPTDAKWGGGGRGGFSKHCRHPTPTPHPPQRCKKGGGGRSVTCIATDTLHLVR